MNHDRIPKPAAEPESVAVEVMPRSDGGIGAEVDIQVATAKRYPRSLSRCLADAKTMAVSTLEIAESCIYNLPRSGKAIAGPSVRLAEIVMSTWGNLRCKSELVEEGAESITCRGTVWDLEKNVAVQSECRRRITDKNGRRYNVDMVTMTVNAAASIALRNAIFRAVPRVVVDEVYGAAKACAVGDMKSIVDRRQRALATFAKLGVTPDRIFARLGIAGEEEITLAHLEMLTGIRSALHEGDSTPEEEFPELPKSKPAPVVVPDPAQACTQPPAPSPGPAESPLGDEGKAESDRLEGIAHEAGLSPQAFAGMRAKLGLKRDATTWTARQCEALEQAIEAQVGAAT